MIPMIGDHDDYDTLMINDHDDSNCSLQRDKLYGHRIPLRLLHPVLQGLA